FLVSPKFRGEQLAHQNTQPDLHLVHSGSVHGGTIQGASGLPVAGKGDGAGWTGTGRRKRPLPTSTPPPPLRDEAASLRVLQNTYPCELLGCPLRARVMEQGG